MSAVQRAMELEKGRSVSARRLENDIKNQKVDKKTQYIETEGLDEDGYETFSFKGDQLGKKTAEQLMKEREQM